MNNNKILGVRFIVKKHRAKENRVPIYARITIEGRTADISLKRHVPLGHWNSATGRVKPNCDGAKPLNAFLDQVRVDLINCHAELKLKNKSTAAENIKNLYCGAPSDNDEQTLKKLIVYHNDHQKHTLAWGTLKNYFTTQKYINLFLQSIKQKDIPLSQLSYRFLADFEVFLKTHQPVDHQKPCGHNTVLKHIERLRKMINLAIKNEWLDRDPFARYKARFIRKDREFLTQQEVDTIQAKTFMIPRLQWAKDLFVFSCYTGLCYADVMNLTMLNITLGIDGEHWISTSRKKTHQSVRLPLLPQAWEILLKYKDNPRAAVAGKLFPNLSNQKLNAYLKEKADLCGIEKNLTFHLARHTFATTVTLMNGVPVETVSKMLGHTSIRTTQLKW